MNERIYQLKISLKGLLPPIWRTFQVAGQITLPDLHLTAQTVMGWENIHLYRFIIDGLPYGDPDTDGWPNVTAAQDILLAQVISQPGQKFIYVYDFGDDWQHVLRVERILSPEANTLYPRCLKGQRACPPENCGGIWQYSTLLDIRQDPDHESYAAVTQQLGPAFDPEAFAPERVNEALLPRNAA
jgi:hypothetical protein